MRGGWLTTTPSSSSFLSMNSSEVSYLPPSVIFRTNIVTTNSPAPADGLNRKTVRRLLDPVQLMLKGQTQSAHRS